MPSDGDADELQPLRTGRSAEPGQIRIAGNETTARQINEAIEEGRVTAGGAIGFLCECGRLGCGSVVELSLAEYEDLRADPLRFVVAPGHEDAADTVETAIEGRYTVVVKRGDAAAHAARTYARAEGPVVQLILSRDRQLSLISLDVDATPENVGVIRGWLVAFAAEHGADNDAQGRIGIAVTEATSNAVLHAYPPGESGKVHVSADIEDDELEVVVADDGHGFRTGTSSGLGAGLQVVARTADRFALRERTPHGIELWMRFALRASAYESGEHPWR
jgi:anti-sigma regulatory factor (Ser/Thr protein kinase)